MRILDINHPRPEFFGTRMPSVLDLAVICGTDSDVSPEELAALARHFPGLERLQLSYVERLLEGGESAGAALLPLTILSRRACARFLRAACAALFFRCPPPLLALPLPPSPCAAVCWRCRGAAAFTLNPRQPPPNPSKAPSRPPTPLNPHQPHPTSSKPSKPCTPPPNRLRDVVLDHVRHMRRETLNLLATIASVRSIELMPEEPEELSGLTADYVATVLRSTAPRPLKITVTPPAYL